MPDTFAGFVDAGYLIAEGARSINRKRTAVRPDAGFVARWFRELAIYDLPGEKFLRAYWYDAAFAPAHPHFERQRPYFDAIAYTPGIQLRLGLLVERRSKLERPIRTALQTTAKGLDIAADHLIAEFDKNWTFYPDRHQKGVDTLMTLDMVRLASRSAFETAVVVSGDRDLAEVVRTVQDYGVRVLVATPNRSTVATEVVQLADGLIDIGEADTRAMLVERPS